MITINQSLPFTASYRQSSFSRISLNVTSERYTRKMKRIYLLRYPHVAFMSVLKGQILQQCVEEFKKMYYDKPNKILYSEYRLVISKGYKYQT